MNVMELLVELQEMDRARDRLQRRLDQVPVRLKAQSDAVAAAQATLETQEQELRQIRAEAERNELEIKTKEEARNKIKDQMSQPRITAKEYTVLQEQLAGILADISSLTDEGIRKLTEAEEKEGALGRLRDELSQAQGAYEGAREELEGSLSDVRADLEGRTGKREEYAATIKAEALAEYERVRLKYKDALAAVDGTIDRAAGRIGNDLHCSACYMAVTSNDALTVMAGSKVFRCKSCTRILYIP